MTGVEPTPGVGSVPGAYSMRDRDQAVYARAGRQITAHPALRMLLSCVWLVYLASPVGSLFQQHYSPPRVAAGIAIILVFCASYIGTLVTWNRPGAWWRWAGLALMFALAGLACVEFGAPKWNVLWIFVSAAAGAVPGTRRVATRAVLAAGACYLAVSVAGHDAVADYLITLLPVVLIGFMMIGGRKQGELMRELTEARDAVVRMAAAQERLRLARDMHDLTGQSLSTITLKSELAGRLIARLPEGPERDRALDEIEQVAGVSRQTLQDIRQAISGYRRPTLAVEAITARGALESAGITPHDDAELTLASGTFDPDAEAALAWCLREAVTNVVRHSGAANCHIGLTRRPDTISLRVRDDGRGGDGQCAQPNMVSSGAGLRGMSERLAAVGGHLELRPSPDGFGLTATVPLTAKPPRAPAAPDTANAALT
ncbi:MAG: sensor histidine kinase [Nocardiopsaceae bacterium]|nr:sensor histidine kinase [Nocardiopsaceae bacterium]